MSEKKLHSLTLNDYDLGDTIKIIPNGRVKIARNRRANSNEIIFIKILNKSNIMKSNQTQHVLNELEIIPNLDHLSIIKFLSFYQDDKYLYLAFEFIPGGDLFTLLKAENNLSIEQSQFYLGQIIFALEYLHSRNIIYRNLKPENILINKNGYIKLTDFELVKNLDDRTYTLCGTPGYMAPEIILNKGYGLGVDWWALGILLYEMICGVDPFADESPMKIYENILEGKIKFTSDFDDTSKSLIKHLLDKDISRRYGNLKNGVEDIKNHEFFKTMNWDKLLKQEIPADFIPKIKAGNELKYFDFYPNSDEKVKAIENDKDPFLKELN